MGIVIRAGRDLGFLWIVLRALGKRELSQLTAFDFVVLVVMGDLIQQGVTLEDMSVTGAMLAVTTMALLDAAFAAVSVRWPGAGRVLEGRRWWWCQRGDVVKEALRNERLDLADLYEAARRRASATCGTSSGASWRPTATSRSSAATTPPRRPTRRRFWRCLTTSSWSRNARTGGRGSGRAEAVEDVAGDLLDLLVVAGQAVGPVGASRW